MTKSVRSSHVLGLFVFSLAAAAAMSLRAAGQGPQRFEVAEVFLELNDTDGDLGLHGLIDGGPWVEMKIEGPAERTLLYVLSRGALRSQNLTELVFESAEPPFDELAPKQFFRRFPEGRYEVEGRLADGSEIESVAFLSHVLAAPPQNVTVSGIPAAENCDAAVLPEVSAPVTIRWDPVTESHPDLGRSGPVKVSRYQLFVEREEVKLSLDLPPSVTEFEIPSGVTSLGDEFKFEIIVRTSTGNNTAVESCFIVR